LWVIALQRYNLQRDLAHMHNPPRSVARGGLFEEDRLSTAPMGTTAPITSEGVDTVSAEPGLLDFDAAGKAFGAWNMPPLSGQ